MLPKPVKTDSQEPKSSVYGQNRCVARQLGRNLPSTFSALLSFLPLQAPLWVGRESSFGRTFFLKAAPSAKEDWLARSQDCKHLTTANSSEHVNSFYSHPSLGNQKAKDTLVISLVLWISTPPAQACNTFLVLVFTVSWHLQCGKP